MVQQVCEAPGALSVNARTCFSCLLSQSRPPCPAVPDASTSSCPPPTSLLVLHVFLSSTLVPPRPHRLSWRTITHSWRRQPANVGWRETAPTCQTHAHTHTPAPRRSAPDAGLPLRCASSSSSSLHIWRSQLLRSAVIIPAETCAPAHTCAGRAERPRAASSAILAATAAPRRSCCSSTTGASLEC